MNIFASYRQQMADHKNSILVFWLVLCFVFIVLDRVLSLIVTDVGSDANMGTNEFVTLIFAFVAALCSFKENFLLSVQNGISRKTLFSARLLTTLSVAVVLSAGDMVLHGINRALCALSGGEVITMYGMLYCGEEAARPIYMLPNFFVEFFLALAVMSVGYFITVLFYRLNKMGKIFVAAGVPILFNIVVPLMDMRFFHMAVSKACGRLIFYMVKLPSHLMVSSIVIFLIFCAAAFLLMRKAVIKR